MKKRVLIVGGYGNFGSVIAHRLAREPDIALIIAGRSETRARGLAQSLGAEWAAIDIVKPLDESLRQIKPDILIHTSGPFQGQSYDVAEACIQHKCHYIDLADGREFVVGISRLDSAARDAGVLVTSGASSVPALTSAIIDKYGPEFQSLETVHYGIATAQKTNRGLATTKGVLSYAGKPFSTLIGGEMRTVYGWLGLHWHKFAGLGWRALSNCDVPDLALFPDRYPGLKTIRFYAGLELPLIQLGLWGMAWLVRLGLLPNLRTLAPTLLSLSRAFDLFGSEDSGFYMELEGRDATGAHKRTTFDLIAKSGDGPIIPCTPAIVTALGLTRGAINQRGAMPCMGLVDLDALLEELKPLNIKWMVHSSRSDAFANP